MRANLELTHGALFSQRVLLALVEAGRLARRGLPRSCRSSRSAPGTRASRCASCSPPTSAPRGLDLDEIFDYDALHALRRRDRRAARRDRLSARAHACGAIGARRAGSIAPREHPRRPAPHRQREGPRDVRRSAGDGRLPSAADGRERPHLHLRRGPPDADPRQGQGADRACRCSGSSRPRTIVANHLHLGHRRRARRGARAGRWSCARCRCCRSSASCAATSPARAGRTTRPPAAVSGIELPAGPARVRAAARADLHAEHEGRAWATTRRSTSSAPPSSSATAR